MKAGLNTISQRYFLGAFGRGLKSYAALYPELIIWMPNFLFQAVGFWLFYRANRR